MGIKALRDKLMEQPLAYKFVQATLAGQGHKAIKSYLKKQIPKQAKKILDQGCGTGEYALLFGDRYTGVDINPDYIKHAGGKYPGKFVVGSATKMPFKDNLFEVCFAVGLHHHLSDSMAKKAFKESLRVVKKNGKVVVVDAMLPKNPLNFPGLILRKMDRGGHVRKWQDTLKLLPDGTKVKSKIISSYPFDYITLVLEKDKS